MKLLNVYLFLFVVVVNILFTGGRLASSDELAFFLTTESLATRGELAINPELVENRTLGKDGKYYLGAGSAQPFLSVPLYIVGYYSTEFLSITEPIKTLTVRATVSLLNQFYGGLIAVVMLAFALKLGYSRPIALFLTLALLFTTNLFPYLKSYMREPQLVFYLLAAVYFLFVFKTQSLNKHLVYAGTFCALGLLTRLTFVVAMPVLFLYLMVILYHASTHGSRVRRLLRGTAYFALPIIVALTTDGIYNYIQFGSIAGTPYAKADFPTPVYVGLFGLLASPGKSYFLFAPLATLGAISFRKFAQENKLEAYLFCGIFLINLLFFSKFFAWAGDGSWGPRYLISTLPFLILPIGVWLQSSAVRKWVALSAATIGLIIQIGGISIYLGNYMREIGEYPYAREFDDPEFLYKSHFIPNYSPVLGHWRMLVRNVPINFSDERPTFKIEKPDERIPLSEEEKSNLLYTLDFWFMYLLYAGVGTGKVFGAVAAIATLTAFFGFKTYRAFFGSEGPGQIRPAAAS